jgi:hypothetical protein
LPTFETDRIFCSLTGTPNEPLSTTRRPNLMR